MAFSPRRAAHNLLPTLLALAHLFIGWKALSYVSNSPAPIAVVTSESMEPGFQRGDVLFLWNRQETIEVGDIALVAFATRKLPMVHRVLQSYYLPRTPDENGASSNAIQYIRTKGDNVPIDDASLYPNEEGLAARENVIGVLPLWHTPKQEQVNPDVTKTFERDTAVSDTTPPGKLGADETFY
ncbi:hypothetical protein NLG97_g5230 [Lecanicillium saksenae]|uniref:Uncharacterized protein n=1 Tax=Lecanicillium saksenae TaxID=468837 RepID=A0ACC1QUQ6_9HYPO|nr:hypothetical protein NLG97_g5230 [Lecanicillium saksenae]